MKVLKIMLGGLFLALIFLSGIWLGEYFEITRSTKQKDYSAKMQSTIAVVNEDLGGMNNGVKRNYSETLIDTLSDDYVLVSAQAAQVGYDKGEYAAVITFPADLSKKIISINALQPEKVTLNFMINPNLPEGKYLEIYSQISAMQLDVNQAIAYMYMDSLLKEFHAGQNEVSSIFQNDEDDMIALGKVKLHNFTEALELGDIPRVPFNPEELDFEPYTEDVKGIGEDMSQEYLDSYAKAKEDYKIIEGELVELADAITDQSDEWQITLTDWRASVLSEVAQIQTYRSSMEEWHQLAVLWNTENQNWHNGLNSYKNSADQWYSNASNWANIAVAWKQSAAGWENDAAEWKSTALEKVHSYNENIVKLAQYYDDLADWQSNLQEYAQSPSGDAPEFTSSGELPDTIDTTSFESAVLTSLPPMNFANVPMVQENLPPAFTAEELATMPELEEYAILSVPLKPQELTDALLQIKEKAAVYDPEQYLTPEVKRRIDYFVEQYSNNLVRLQGDMELNQDKNIGLLQEAYYEYNNYVFELRMQALETHDEEQKNLKTGLGIFYTAKMQTSEENRALLGSFANKLPYSRRGTSVNGEIVEFSIAPLRFTHINIRPARTVDELGQHDLQKTTQAAMLYVFVLMCILVLVVMALYLNDKQKNTKKLRELTAAG